MARRPLKTKEQIAAVPLDQSVELDLTPDDPVIEIIDDTTAPKANGAATEAPVVERPREPEPEDDRLALKKQADDLKAAEEVKAAHARREQEIEALRQQNQQLLAEQQQTRSYGINARHGEIKSYIAEREAQVKAFVAAYKNAAAVGDHDEMGEQQQNISRGEAELVDMRNRLWEVEYQMKQMEQAPPPQQQQPSQPSQEQVFEQHIQQFPAIVQNWMRGHKDYMEPNSLKNDKLQRAALDAKIAGIALYSQDFVDYIDGQLFPKDEEEAPDLEPARRTPVSAPVSRESMSPSTGRPTTQKITLSVEERQTARQIMPDVDPGEAERVYAQNKMKMLEAKKNGQYRD